MSDEGTSGPCFWRRALRPGFGPGFWGFFAFALVTGAVCCLVLGLEAFGEALERDVELVLTTLTTLPRVAVALGVAGLVWVLLPRERIIRLVGAESGLRGLVVATLAGTVTPGGPAAAFSLLAVLAGP